MANHQETVADSSMVELSQMMRSGDGEGVGVEKERVESAVESKEEGLKEMLQRADDLRLKTLKAVIDMSSPIQGVHFLIAAAELHLTIHDNHHNRNNNTATANPIAPATKVAKTRVS
ncbi:protein DOG1-like 4 [Durio zibethinus]|uniref:Protein DOG1-like 4 n=1 Tax=Durio zibethinus TaxID=66656 RepID=A0A6P6BCN2_DURZI|nr:protein DOG1-like 4 [Durio zibethinus]